MKPKIRYMTQNWLLKCVSEQQAWMKACGETLTGYINHYGEYGRSPDESAEIYNADLAVLRNLETRLAGR